MQLIAEAARPCMANDSQGSILTRHQYQELGTAQSTGLEEERSMTDEPSESQCSVKKLLCCLFGCTSIGLPTLISVPFMAPTSKALMDQSANLCQQAGGRLRGMANRPDKPRPHSQLLLGKINSRNFLQVFFELLGTSESLLALSSGPVLIIRGCEGIGSVEYAQKQYRVLGVPTSSMLSIQMIRLEEHALGSLHTDFQGGTLKAQLEFNLAQASFILESADTFQLSPDSKIHLQVEANCHQPEDLKVSVDMGSLEIDGARGLPIEVQLKKELLYIVLSLLGFFLEGQTHQLTLIQATEYISDGLSFLKLGRFSHQTLHDLAHRTIDRGCSLAPNTTESFEIAMDADPATRQLSMMSQVAAKVGLYGSQQHRNISERR